MLSTRQQGQNTEDLACRYLDKKGLLLIEKNFNSRLGEIDLIMQDKECLVFIEVRYRKNIRFGDGAESITYNKQQKLIKAASLYLQKHTKLSTYPARFDVVSITGSVESNDINTIDFNWIKNAFEA